MTRRSRRGLGQVAGETHPAAKLTDELVLCLRVAAEADPQFAPGVFARALGFGVSDAAASMAVRGTTWRHLPYAVRRDRRHGRRPVSYRSTP